MDKPLELAFTGPKSPQPDGAEMPRSEFRNLVDSLVDGVIVISGSGTMLRANVAVCEMLGYQEAELLGQNVSMLMNGYDAEHHDQYLANYLETGRAHIIGIGREVDARHRDGQLVPVKLSVTSAQINNETMYVGVLHDITERKEQEALFRRNNKIMRSVNQALANAINEGLSTREVFDSALEDLLEVSDSEYGFIGEILHRNNVPYLKTHAITNIAWNHDTRKFYKENVRNGLEFTNLDSLFGVTIRTGQQVIANDPYDDPRRGGLPKGHPPLRKYLGVPIYSGSKLMGMAGVANRSEGYSEELAEQIKPLVSALGTLIAAHQNTESRIRAEEELYKTQQQLKQMATKDPVTGIANRYLLVQELEMLYEQCREGDELSVLFVDVDHFKRINDQHGHDLGDRVLRHVAENLGTSLRPSDVVGRYGGEEFLIGLPGCSLKNAGVIAERMREALEASPFGLDDGGQLDLSVSIGVASFSQKPEDLAQLIRFADQAMYAAKDGGRNCVQLHEISSAA